MKLLKISISKPLIGRIVLCLFDVQKVTLFACVHTQSCLKCDNNNNNNNNRLTSSRKPLTVCLSCTPMTL